MHEDRLALVPDDEPRFTPVLVTTLVSCPGCYCAIARPDLRRHQAVACTARLPAVPDDLTSLGPEAGLEAV